MMTAQPDFNTCVFPTASASPRPVRLSASTRAWAWESLHGKYGDEAMKTPHLAMDDVPGFASLSPVQKYDRAILKIASDAPLRLCPEEKICGAATLGAATWHTVPVQYQGNFVVGSVSHLTIRYDKVLRQGLTAYRADIRQRLQDPALTETQIEFLHSLETVIDAIAIWHNRYLQATETVRPDLHQLLLQVPFSPARNFHEALQSLWFIFSFVRLCGNWPGIGRLDWLLGDFLQADLKSGALAWEDARELLASFFIKGCEWIQSDMPVGSGDAQHYQNLVLAGVDETGRELTNEVTFLTLEVVEELSISDYPITVRLNSRSPRSLKEKVAAVMQHGGGIVAVYNEDLILHALVQEGYPLAEARMFANDGCWEVQIPGKTHFGYVPFDGLQILHAAMGVTAETAVEFDGIESVYQAFLAGLRSQIHSIYKTYVQDHYAFEQGRWHAKNPCTPTSVISLFEDGCMDSAQSYCDHGAAYTVVSPHIGGTPDIANSLYAIERFVFQEQKLTFAQLVTLMQNNWEDNELLRLYIKNHSLFYGNDEDAVDAWHSRILADFAAIVQECRALLGDCQVKFVPGVSTFGRQINWLPNRTATAFGYKKGDILAGNDSPTPGTDTQGATSIIKSYCKSDLALQSCGAALDIKLFPQSISGENGIRSLVSLMDGFVSLGGFFMQLDAVDAETLLAAQREPQKYKTLSVRVSGWNARFVTLNQEWQNMIIQRTTQNI